MKSFEMIGKDGRVAFLKQEFFPGVKQGYINLSNGKKGTVIAGANEDGWEHVSVELYGKRLPTWDEMCEVKDIFWDDEETVIQMHPRKSKYVNLTEALHLWRPADGNWDLMNKEDK